MSLNFAIGSPARGNNFFNRPKIIAELWQKIQADRNILITAPRRVGKTSIMFHLLDNPKKNFQVIYIITQSINNENEFFKKIFYEIVETLKGIKKYSEKVSNFAKTVFNRIDAIGKDGITLGENSLNYYNELIELIKSLELDGEKLVVMIDEYAETIENIIRDENESSAIHFLQSNRELCQLSEINTKIQFIYAGSIGLENIVAKLNASDKINHISSQQIPSLTKSESAELIQMITKNSNLIINNDVIEYLLLKIEWLIPFHIQLIVDELHKLAPDTKIFEVNNSHIDKAFKNALEQRNHFESWLTRLRKAYKGNDFNFIKNVLNIASKNQSITSAQISDLAVKYKIQNSYTDLINALKHDGYLNNEDDSQKFNFNSPLLKQWWLQNVAIYI